MRSRLSTTRGIAATIVTVLVVISGVSGGKEPAVALSALLIISPVIWWLSWWDLLPQAPMVCGLGYAPV